jgi:hypothetical protein
MLYTFERRVLQVVQVCWVWRRGCSGDGYVAWKLMELVEKCLCHLSICMLLFLLNWCQIKYKVSMSNLVIKPSCQSSNLRKLMIFYLGLFDIYSRPTFHRKYRFLDGGYFYRVTTRDELANKVLAYVYCTSCVLWFTGGWAMPSPFFSFLQVPLLL